MNVTKKDLEKRQVELTVEVSVEEFTPYIQKGAEIISKDIKIEGFRPGKVPFEILKQKIGEMTILEEAARQLINKQVYKVIEENMKGENIIGQPEVDISKIAPNNPLEYKIKLTLLPEVKLGSYKDFNIESENFEADEKEVNKLLNDLLDMRASEKISLDPIKNGDKIIASVNLFLGKVPVEDGQNPDVTVLIGKDYFVQGFDKYLLGLNKGEKKEFSINYPANHWQKNLAGKLVSFEVKIKEIYDREIPEINDDLAKMFKFKNVEDLKKNIKESISLQKKKELDQKTEVKILDKIVESSKFSDIPDNLIKNETELMIKEIERSIISQGANFDDYLKSIKKSLDQLKLDLMPKAVKRVKSALALKEIAKIEVIKVSEEKINQEINKLKEEYKQNPEALKNLTNLAYRHYLKDHLLNQEIITKLKEWNVK